MSFRSNLIANYIVQIYVIAIGIIMVPVYVRYMGAEAYGLIGFFSMLLTWFQLLDVGLTPTLARETARYRGKAIDALTLCRLLRAMEGIFLFLAIAGAGIIIVASSWIAHHWLQGKQLPSNDIKNSLNLMAIIIGLRWISGLYRSAITGFEQQVWLSGFNAVVATLRFVGVIFVFIWIGTAPTIFFAYQLFVALIELIGGFKKTQQLMPALSVHEKIGWSFAPIRKILTFSLGLAFTGSIWVFVTQTDKLILSKILSLKEYGYYTLAVLLAGGVTIISGPISAVLLPRLVRIEAEGNHEEMINLYRNATQIVSVISIPTALILAVLPIQILTLWTGNKEAAIAAAPILSLYAIGNGILAISAFPYYLQYAKGNLKLHFKGSLFFLFLLMPLLLLLAWKLGGIGAGIAWLIANVGYFLFWIPFVHKKFANGIHRKWIMDDIGAVVIFPILISLLLYKFPIIFSSRLIQGAWVVGVAIILFIVSACGSSSVRQLIKARIS